MLKEYICTISTIKTKNVKYNNMNNITRLIVDQNEVWQKCEIMKRNCVLEIRIIVVKCLYLSGSRISALLNVSYNDILPDGSFVIHQGKGSNAISCYCAEYLRYFQQCREYKQKPFEGVNYISIYRLLKEYGLIQRQTFGNNTAVTSLGRKLKAVQMAEQGQSIEDIANILGHKSTTSTEYYLTKKPQKKRTAGGVLANSSSTYSSIVQCKNGVIKVRTK